MAFKLRILQLLDDAPPACIVEIFRETEEETRQVVKAVLKYGYKGTQPERIAINQQITDARCRPLAQIDWEKQQ